MQVEKGDGFVRLLYDNGEACLEIRQDYDNIEFQAKDEKAYTFYLSILESFISGLEELRDNARFYIRVEEGYYDWNDE